VKVWDAAAGKELIAVKGCCVAFSPDGRQLVTALGNRAGPSERPTEVKLWDAATGQEVQTLRGDNWLTTYVAFTPDGEQLLAASVGHTVNVWDAKSGQEVRRFSYTPSGRGDSIALSPDGKHLACASEDADTYQPIVRIYDVTSGREALRLTGYANRVMGLVYSPDGKRLATGGGDETLKVWDVTTGQEILTLAGHGNPVTGVAFSPDGRLLASSSRSEVKIWDATPPDDGPRK
jgi:WD40 repeat protein